MGAVVGPLRRVQTGLRPRFSFEAGLIANTQRTRSALKYGDLRRHSVLAVSLASRVISASIAKTDYVVYEVIDRNTEQALKLSSIAGIDRRHARI